MRTKPWVTVTVTDSPASSSDHQHFDTCRTPQSHPGIRNIWPKQERGGGRLRRMTTKVKGRTCLSHRMRCKITDHFGVQF